jgi:hypothetical protein
VKSKYRKESKIPNLMKMKNTAYQNLWDKGKAVLRGKFIDTSVYIKKTNNLMMHLKLLEKQEQTRPKTSREIIKIRDEINEI